MSTRERSSSTSKSDRSANGNGPGEQALKELVDQLAGFGITRDALVAFLLADPQDGEGWPDPRPLPGSAAAPPWPGGLGRVADAFVKAVAESTGTYPDITGMCVLGVVGAVTADVVVQVNDDWFEPGVFQGIVIAVSGERKTPPFIAAKAPLDYIERRLSEGMQPLIDQSETKERILKGRLKAAETAAIKAKDAGERAAHQAEMEQIAKELEEHKKLVLPRFYTRNATPEAILKVMGKHGGTLAVLSDEARIFFQAAGQYKPKGEGDFDIYIAGWDGERYISDRVGRDTIDVPHVCLPYLLMGQPKVLETMGRDQLAAGLGLYARPLFSMPPTRVGNRPTDAPGVPKDARTAWQRLIHILVKQTMGLWFDDDGRLRIGDADDDKALVAGAERILHRNGGGVLEDRDHGHDDQHILPLSPEAQAAFRDFRRRHEPRLDARSGDLGHIADWGSKLPGQVLRLAGRLHAMRTGSIHGTVTEDTMNAALALADYFTGHALVVFGRMGAGPGVADAAHLRDWLFRHPADAVATRTIAMSTDWDTDRVRAALEFLGRYDWVRKLPAVNQPGRPSEQWALNPAFYERGAM